MAPFTLSVVFIAILGLTGFNAQDNGGGKCNTVETRLDGIERAITGMKDFLRSEMDFLRSQMKPPLQFFYDESPAAYSGCQDALERGQTTSGVYTIAPDQKNSFNSFNTIAPDQDNSFDVYCEQQLDGGGWTVFQVRKDGSVDFYRDWNAYKEGFGNLKGEFWLGNTNLHLLTRSSKQELKVELTRPNGQVQFADYSHFSIAPEADNFRLSVTGYTGGITPGDSMSHSNGHEFSTFDKDHDNWSKVFCAKLHHSGWWFRHCTSSNLNGRYGGSDTSRKGVYWVTWSDSYQSLQEPGRDSYESLKATRMMMRPRTS